LISLILFSVCTLLFVFCNAFIKIEKLLYVIPSLLAMFIVIISWYFLNVEYNLFTLACVNVLILISALKRTQGKWTFLGGVTLYSPLISSVVVNYELYSFLAGITLVYCAFIIIIKTSGEEVNQWYLGVFLALSTSLVTIIFHGFSTSDILRLDELLLYIDLGYLNLSVLIIPLLLLMGSVINPLTVRHGQSAFVLRWVSSMYFYLTLVSLPVGAMALFSDNFEIFILIFFCWWFVHLAFADRSAALESALAFLLPLVLIQENVNVALVQLLVILFSCSSLVYFDGGRLISCLFAAMGVMTLGLLGYIDTTTLFSEVVLLLFLYALWRNIDAQCRSAGAPC